MQIPISAIVLAAGLSRRAAPHNKLLLPFRDTTVVRATVAAMCEADFAEVVVVVGHERERVEAALTKLPVRFVFAEDFAQGMGNSLAAGVRAASGNARGFAVTPGDLPQLTSALARTITAKFIGHDCARHVIPAADGDRGHPVLLGTWLRSKLESLSGDMGARTLLAGPNERLRCTIFELGDPAILRDVDGP